MKSNIHKIVVIFDADYGPNLGSLEKDFHIWIKKSEANDETIKNYMSLREAQGLDPLAHGITHFDDSSLNPGLLECIWDHHGDFAHDPPLSEIKIIGLELNSSVSELIKNFQFEVTSSTEGEFTVINMEK